MFTCRSATCPGPCGGVDDSETSRGPRGPSRNFEEEATGLQDAQPVDGISQGEVPADATNGNCQEIIAASGFAGKLTADLGQQLASIAVNLGLTNDTIHKAVGSRKEVVHSLCNSLQKEAQQYLSRPNPLWRNLLRGVSPAILPEEVAKMKMIALASCAKQLAAIQDHEPTYFDNDANFLEAMQRSVRCATSTKFCDGKVLLEIAEALDREQAGLQRTWRERLSSIARCLLEDDFAAQSVELEAAYDGIELPDGDDIECVFNLLGFKQWQGLWVEAGPDFTWEDGCMQRWRTLPQISDRQLPQGCWLVELEGCKDLVQAARSLREKWHRSCRDLAGTRLKARFAVAQPRQQKDLREGWLQSFRSGSLEAVAVRLQRVWALAPPSSFHEEWLFTKVLKDEEVKVWASAFRAAAAAGVFPPTPEELGFNQDKGGYPLRYCSALWSGLASSLHLKILDLSDCDLAPTFLETLEAALSDSTIAGQNPFPNLRELRLSDNPALGANLVRVDSLVQILVARSNLQVLNLESCDLDAAFAMALVSALQKKEGGCRCWPKLRRLTLHNNERLGAALREPSVFVKGLAVLPALEALDLRKCGLGPSFCMALASLLLEKEAVSKWPNLKELRLSKNPHLGTDLQGPITFAKGLVALPVLEVLHLTCCDLNASFASALASAMLERNATAGGGHGCWPKLKDLRLGWNERLGTDLEYPVALATALTSLPSLEALSLKCCDLDSFFAMALASAMLEKEACWPKLKELWLGWNRRLGAELPEPSEFTKGLAALPALEVLGLDHCSWNDVFGNALIPRDPEVKSHPRPWPKLKELMLEGHAFNEETASKLKEWFAQEHPHVQTSLGERQKQKLRNSKSSSKANSSEKRSERSLCQRCCGALCLKGGGGGR